MSKIIKGDHLQVYEPRLLELSKILTSQEKEESSQEQIDGQNVTNNSIMDLEKEAARIFQETEQMMVDLLQKSRNEAHDILDSAREEAELTRSKAQEEAQHLRETAFQEGYQAGVESARQAMQAEMTKTTQQCQQLLDEARHTKMAMFRSSEADMLRVCLAVAKRVVAAEVTTNSEVVCSILEEALSYIDQLDNLTLYVNQKDLETVLELMQINNLSDMGNKVTLDVQVDNRISPGGVRLDSEIGAVDARMETRLANVEKAFQEVLLDE